MQNITIKIQNGGMVVSLDEPKDAAERRVQVEDIMLAWNFHAPNNSEKMRTNRNFLEWLISEGWIKRGNDGKRNNGL